MIYHRFMWLFGPDNFRSRVGRLFGDRRGIRTLLALMPNSATTSNIGALIWALGFGCLTVPSSEERFIRLFASFWCGFLIVCDWWMWLFGALSLGLGFCEWSYTAPISQGIADYLEFHRGKRILVVLILNSVATNKMRTGGCYWFAVTGASRIG